jgi:hypothetical protein
MQSALDMLKWAKADAVIVNMFLADPSAVESLFVCLDDSEIPSIVANWMSLPTTSR